MSVKRWMAVPAACIGIAILAIASKRLSEDRPARGGPADVSSGSQLSVSPIVTAAPEIVPTTPVEARTSVHEESNGSTRIRGRVVDHSSQPIAGASVSAAPPRHPPSKVWSVLALESELTMPGLEPAVFSRAETDVQGAFELRVAAADELYVAVRRPGFVGLDLVYERAPELDLGTLALETGAVQPGRVVNEVGQPVGGAEVLRLGSGDRRIDWSEARIATSADDGTFTLDSLALGRTSLEVRAPGFVPLRRELFADAFQLPEWRVELARAAPITGRVVGAPPDLQAFVSYWRQDLGEVFHVPCARDGSFVVDGLPPDLPEVRLHAVKRTWSAVETISPAVVALPGTRNVEIRVPPPTTYRLRVADSGTGAPIVDARIVPMPSWGTLESAPAVARLGDDGAYTVPLLLPYDENDYLALAITHAGHEGVIVGELPFTPGETTDLGVVLLDSLESTALRVVDSDQNPVTGARVRVELAPLEGDDWNDLPKRWPVRSGLPATFEGTTGEDGTAIASLSNAQRYLIKVQHEGHAPQDARLDTGTHPPPELELRLLRGGTVSLLCLDDVTRMPLAESWIQHEPELGVSGSGDSDGASTDSQGRARFEHLAPGLHRFWWSTSESDIDENAEFVNVTDGAEIEVRLFRHPEVLVSLQGVLTERGRPLAGAMVDVGGYEVATDIDGRYEVTGLEPGEEDLAITHPRSGPLHVQAIVLVAPETRIDIELAPVPLRGVIRDPEGAPIAGAGAWVTLRQANGRFEFLAADEAMQQTTSGADGSFGFVAVQPREDLYLVISKAGFLTERVGPLAFPRDDSPLELAPRLERAATIEVTVQNWDDRTLGLPEVVAVWRGTEALEVDDREQKVSRSANISGAGELRFRFDTLTPGAWTLLLRKAYSSGTEESLAQIAVELHPGKNDPLVLRP